MRLIKMLGLATIAAVAAMALVGATSASASTPTQVCNLHVGLECLESQGTASVHMTLKTGTVGKLLSDLVVILCLGVLFEATPLGLAQPQLVHVTSSEYTGCGTGSAHSNCTVAAVEEPLVKLLKTGLDQGSLTSTSGEVFFECTNLGLQCLYDVENTLVSVGAQHLTAADTVIKELGEEFFCPGAGKLDGLLKTLANRYVLQ